MGDPPLLRGLLLGLCTVLLAFNFSGATPQTERIVAVVGNSECLDCSEKSINTEEAFKGLHVSIHCKTGNGLYETKGEGLLDKSGSFDVQLPSTVLREDGELKDECFAQLRSASEAACPDNVGVDQSKIVLKSKENGKHTFAVKAGKLPFSSACTSAFLLKHHHKFHKDLPFHKDKPKFDFHHHYLPHKHFFPPKPYFPPKPKLKFDFHHHYLPHKPLFPPKPYFPPKEPLPPPVPEYMPPPVPEYKPPPVPEYKPPIVKKPFPPFPIYKKPHPPIPKLPPLDHLHPKIELPPIHKKPLPPIHEFPPIHKKPLHPIPEFKFPPKPEFHKKKHPIFPPVKEHPIP